MPTYEFRCNACNQQFEVFQSMSAPDPAACELCGVQGQLEKVLFPVAVHYKGSGFYSTDYKGSGGAKSSGATTDGASSNDSSSSSSDAGSGSSSSSSSSDSSKTSASTGD